LGDSLPLLMNIREILTRQNRMNEYVYQVMKSMNDELKILGDALEMYEKRIGEIELKLMQLENR